MPVSKYACYYRPLRLYSWSSTCCFLPCFFIGSCICRSQFLLLFLTDGFQKYRLGKQFHTEGNMPQAKLFDTVALPWVWSQGWDSFSTIGQLRKSTKFPGQNWPLTNHPWQCKKWQHNNNQSFNPTIIYFKH
jgi:hypothetical protein